MLKNNKLAQNLINSLEDLNMKMTAEAFKKEINQQLLSKSDESKNL